jgi:ABC-type transport system involved in cytochrome bd biosynthesis fused ATPase/permease subunit
VIDQIETLAFDDVHFQHLTASTPALAGISFRTKLGETIAFVGPSGSGKTLVKLLVGLCRRGPDSLQLSSTSTHCAKSTKIAGLGAYRRESACSRRSQWRDASLRPVSTR